MGKSIRVFLLALFAFIPALLSAQPGTWLVQGKGTAGEVPKDMVIGAGEYIFFTGDFSDTLRMGGYELVSRGNSDVFYGKMDKDGNMIWLKSYGSPNNEFAECIAYDASSDQFLIGGEFQDSVFIDGDTIVTNSSVFGSLDLIVTRFDTAGNRIWSYWPTFGSGSDFVYDMEVDGTGHTYFTGKFRSNLQLGAYNMQQTRPVGEVGKEDVYIARLAPNAVVEWAYNDGSLFFDEANELELVGDSMLFIAGSFQDTFYFGDTTGGAPWDDILVAKEKYDVFIAAYDTAGNYRWSRAIGGPENDYVDAMATDGFELYVTGTYVDTIYTPAGVVTTPWAQEIFLTRYETDGSFVNFYGMGGPGFQRVNSITGTTSGDWLVTGFFEDQVDFLSETFATDPSNQDGMVVRFDPNFVGQSHMTFGGFSVDNGAVIKEGSGEYFYVFGTFADTARFGGTTLASLAAEDIFLFRASKDYVLEIDGLDVGAMPLQAKIWPNPNTGVFRLGFELPRAAAVSVQILDLQGRMVFETPLQSYGAGSHTEAFDLSHLPAGMYIWRIGGDAAAVGRMVISR